MFLRHCLSNALASHTSTFLSFFFPSPSHVPSLRHTQPTRTSFSPATLPFSPFPISFRDTTKTFQVITTSQMNKKWWLGGSWKCLHFSCSGTRWGPERSQAGSEGEGAVSASDYYLSDCWLPGIYSWAQWGFRGPFFRVVRGKKVQHVCAMSWKVGDGRVHCLRR